MANIVDYFEVAGTDPEGSSSFYTGLFDWEVGPNTPAAYRNVNSGKGGMWDTTAMGGEKWAIFYVHVDDVAESLAKAVELGATVAIPIVDNGQITFAHLIDPQGNRFGIWKPNADRVLQG